MAIPSYTTDLTDITLDDGTFSVLGGGRVTIGETDDFFQGLNCWSHDPFSSGTEGGAFNSAQTITAGNAALIWTKCDVAATLATKALGGIQAVIGSSANDYKTWYVFGSDDYAAGGWKCVAIDPIITNSGVVGTPTAATDFFGVQWYVPATGASKGYPMKIDAIRQGRAQMLITDGQTGDLANFDGMAAINDLQANKWGLFEAIAAGTSKAGYRFKGLQSFGTTATPVEFTDSDKNIVIENTEYVGASFNRIEMKNIASTVNFNNISYTALGTVSRGELEMIDNCTHNDTGGIFTGMSTFTYLPGATIVGRTYRSCELVTQGGATMTSCVYDKPSGAVGLLSSAATLGLVDKGEFKSSGVGYGVGLGTVSVTISCDWKSIETDYVVGVTGTNVGVTPTGNETIIVNVDVDVILTVNVATGASVPSIANSGLGTVNVVAGQVISTLVGHPVGATVIVYDLDSSDPQELGTRLATFENAAAIVQYQYSGDKAGDDVQAKALMSGYRTLSKPVILPATDNVIDTKMTQETN